MTDFFDAYRSRLERNQADIFALIKDVQALNPSIEAYVHHDTGRFQQGVVFIRNEEINSIHFHEVPYRWSGCGHGEFNNSHSGGENCSMPFTVEDVLKTFKPINTVRWRYKDKHGLESVYFKNKQHYLEWCSYLKKYEQNIEKINGS